MDPYNNPFNTQNSDNFPFNYNNPYNFQFENQSSNQPRSQNISNIRFSPNFMPSAVPNFHPYHGMQFQPPQMQHQNFQNFHPYMPMGNENISYSGATEFPGFSTQVPIGNIPTAEGSTIPTGEGSTTFRRKHSKWTTSENLVLLSGWMKFGTDSVVGRNQKGDTYWRKISDYCNEHCSFESPRDIVACKNHYNYINKILGKWLGAHEKAKRMQQSGWSEDDVLARAHELYTSETNCNFTLIQEWRAIQNQPRYASQVGGNTGSDSSGSKRAREYDPSDSNSIGSIPRPMGREAAKKKGRRKDKGVGLETVNEDFTKFQQLKEKELERLDTIAIQQQEAIKAQEEANRQQHEANRCNKMNLWMQLREKEHLDDRSKQLFDMLTSELFGN